MLTPSQQQAVNAPTHSALIANAGSGKTHTLVQKYLHALETNPDLSNSSIIAITFTDNAAAELKEKITKGIRERITQLQDLEAPHEIIDRLWNAFDTIDSSNISTIHSFCSRLLKQYPIEAGIDPSFAILDQVQRSLLSDECINSTFYKILSELAQDTEEKEETGTTIFETFKKFGRNRLAATIRSMLFRRAAATKAGMILREKSDAELIAYSNTLFLQQVKPVILSEITQTAITTLFSFTKEISALAKKQSDTFTKLEIAYDFWMLSNTIEDKIIRLEALIGLLLTKDYTPRKTLFEKKNVLSFVSDAESIIATSLSEIIELLPAFEAFSDFNDNEKNELPHLRNIISIYESVLDTYTKEKINQGFLDHDELIERAILLLRQPIIGTNIAEGYRYCFVDEYQDTDEQQYTIVNLLSDSFKNNSTVTIVGDPKQSIYRFRDADLQLFRRSVAESTNSSPDAQIIELRESFRMLAAPMAFINTVTDALFGADETIRSQYYYNPLVLGRNADSDGSISFLIANGPKKNSRDDADATEPDQEDDEENETPPTITEEELIASSITGFLSQLTVKDLHDTEAPRKYRYSDIAILMRKRKQLPILELALKSKGIPYTMSGGMGFYQQQEIIDALNVLRFLIDTSDMLSLVAVLRSPYFGMDDRSLWNITHQWHLTARTISFWDFITDPNCDLMFPFADRLRLLTDLLPLVGKIRTRTLLEHVIRNSQIELVYYSFKDGDQKVSNIRKLCDLASNGDLTVWEFVEQSTILQERTEREQQAAVEVTDDAVRIMTIHGSKGLQFPIVILPYLNDNGKKPNDTSSSMLRRDEPFIAIQQEREFTVIDHPITALAKINEKREEEQEERRILYVALTRAADHLVLSATLNAGEIARASALASITSALHLTASELIVVDHYPLVRDIECYKDNATDSQYEERTISAHIPIIREPLLVETPHEEAVAVEVIDTIIDLRTYPSSAGITRYSPTQLLSYLECPTKYYLRYKLGLPEEEKKQRASGEYIVNDQYDVADYSENIQATIYGQVLHRTLERIGSFISGGAIDHLQLRALYQKLEAEFHITKHSPEYFQRLEREVSIFENAPLFKEIISATQTNAEIQLRYALDDHRIISGIIDRVYLGSDGMWNVVDYKTTAHPTPEDISRYSFQISVYAYLMCRLHSATQVKTHLYFSRTGETITNIFTQEQFNTIEAELIRIVTAIVADGKVKSLTALTKNRSYCSECQYSPDKIATCVVDPVIKLETISLV